MKLYGTEDVLLMEVEAISAHERNLHIKGKMMGQVPMKVVVRPSDLREALKMLSLSLIIHCIGMLFTKNPGKTSSLTK